MKAKIEEIRKWYNGSGELIEHAIKYESGRTAGYFRDLSKTGEEWLKKAVMVKRFKKDQWTCEVYRKEA